MIISVRSGLKADGVTPVAALRWAASMAPPTTIGRLPAAPKAGRGPVAVSLRPTDVRTDQLDAMITRAVAQQRSHRSGKLDVIKRADLVGHRSMGKSLVGRYVSDPARATASTS